MPSTPDFEAFSTARRRLDQRGTDTSQRVSFITDAACAWTTDGSFRIRSVGAGQDGGNYLAGGQTAGDRSECWWWEQRPLVVRNALTSPSAGRIRTTACRACGGDLVDFVSSGSARSIAGSDRSGSTHAGRCRVTAAGVFAELLHYRLEPGGRSVGMARQVATTSAYAADPWTHAGHSAISGVSIPRRRPSARTPAQWYDQSRDQAS
jgi:hypothetical protein